MLKALLWTSIACVALYAALCAWLYVAQRSLVYFPQYTRVDAASADFALARDGATLRGWRLHASGRDPIVYFGGNAERVEANRDAFARMFPDRPLYLLAYRGYGASDGTPSSEAIKADALALFDHVRAAHPGQRIDVIGRSLGSGVAAHVAAHGPVHRLVLVTPFDSLDAVASTHYPFVPVRLLMRERFDSAEALRKARMPILILRAGDDAVIPAERTHALRTATPHAREIVIEGAGHDSISGHAAYEHALAAFMR